MKVNDEMLRFYWSIGRDISAMHLDAEYDDGFYQAVSTDLQDVFSGGTFIFCYEPEIHEVFL